MLVRYCTAVALKRHERVNAFNLVDVSLHTVLCQCRHLSVMLSNVLQLRSSNWGRNVADTPVMAVSHALIYATADEAVHVYVLQLFFCF